MDDIPIKLFELYDVLLEESEKRKTKKFCFQKELVYHKYKKICVSEKHTEFIFCIIMEYMKRNDEEKFNKIVQLHKKSFKGKDKEKDKKLGGKYTGFIYDNKRVFKGEILGESHDMSTFPDDLLRILEVHIDYYFELRNNHEKTP